MEENHKQLSIQLASIRPLGEATRAFPYTVAGDDFGVDFYVEEVAYATGADHATINLKASHSQGEVLISGTAVRSPEDHWDDEVAYKLCLSRALRALSDRLARQANGRMESNDHNRASQLEALEKRKAKAVEATERRERRLAEKERLLSENKTAVIEENHP